MKPIIFDLEGDGFIPTKIHVVSAEINGKIVSYTDYESMRKLFTEAEVLIGHNITRFDIPVIERLLDIKVKAELIDTLALSWYLYPKRLKHGLEDWGEHFGVPKPKVDDWENLPLKEYVNRCQEDVKINKNLWKKIMKDLKKLYNGDMSEIKRLVRYLQFKMDCAREQERSQWKLNVDQARHWYEVLTKEKDKKLPQLIKVMPKVPVIQKRKRPAKPFKKDGTLSVTGVKWFSLLKKQGLPEDYDGEVEVVVKENEANPASVQQVKSWLFDLGWEPENFDYKRDKDTGEVRKIPQLKSEADDGTLCPSVIRLAEEIPEIKLLEGMSMLTHRIGFFKAFLENEEGGYLKAEIAGFTNTLRFKHKKPLANIPKPAGNVPYGKEIRSCLIANEGEILCGSDMSSLEDRTKLHYMFEYDPDYVRDMSAEGFDPHLDLAMSGGALTLEQVNNHKSGKEDFTLIRHKYKTANYACIYGVQALTLARQLKITQSEAQSIIDAYWKRNWSVEQLAEDTVTKKVDGQMWLFNPVSKFWYSLRHKKDIFSTLNQGTGVYAFDTWVKYVRSKRPQLTAQFHDEIVLSIRKGAEDKCRKLLRWAIGKVNEELKLNRELDIDIQFGDCYADVH